MRREAHLAVRRETFEPGTSLRCKAHLAVRRAVVVLQDRFRASQRRACRLVGQNRTTQRRPVPVADIEEHKPGGGFGSWPGATSAGVGDWFAGACESRVGASTTSGCNGSGARRGSRGPCHASRSAHDPQTASESYSEPSTRTMCGQSTFNSTKQWMDAD